uniref:COMM domain-containing protein n=1 Tax=Piliocolobus tephrosceles TaxID=591936 RepID=A0A8C9GT10_9PRIM
MGTRGPCWFCGDLDCPGWVLAEISTLAKMSSVKLQLLCSQVAGATVTPSVPLTGPSESGDVKATVAVLSFILSSAAKHSVDGESLASELQQLGLPQEHAAGMCHCYEEKQSPLQKHLWVCNLRSKYEASQGRDREGSGFFLTHLQLPLPLAPSPGDREPGMLCPVEEFPFLMVRDGNQLGVGGMRGLGLSQPCLTFEGWHLGGSMV